MNIKDMVLMAGLALLMTWGMDHFIFSRFRPQEQVEQAAGQMFSAPEQNRTVKPLVREIDFIDTRRSAQEIVSKIETDWATLTFSSEGAALERLQFKRDSFGVEKDMITIFPATERNEKAFLIALNEKTPYYFTLVEKADSDEATSLTYEGSYGDGILRKTFKVYKNVVKIDLTAEVVAKNAEQKTTLRIFVPSPVMPNVKNDQISGIFSSPSGSVEKVAYGKINLHTGWWHPSMFGTENRYFIHALISDEQHCLERAFFNLLPENKIVAIFETSEMNSGSICALSFYMGPKDDQAVEAVDPRLEQTFEHSGMLAPLSRLLLKLLNFIYRYVHNYGFAILILTLLMRLVLLPFMLKSERSMKKGAELQQRMDYLKKKYKNDPERLRLEQAELIKKYGGAAQMLGCLPMLLQFPIFIALNRVLSSSVELYRAPFVGWIQDLSAPDPYYLLPILIFVSMVANACTMDPKQRGTMLMVAVVVSAVSINFAAGLLLYLIAGTLLGVAQSYIQKKMKAA